MTAAPATATTWVVDDNGGPGVDFVNVQDAVDAAADGDVIEVRGGSYPPFTIDGKSLVVIETEGVVFLAAPVVVQNIPAGGKVELDGLSIGPPLAMPPNTVSLHIGQSAGSVRLVDCRVSGLASACQGTPTGALSAAYSDELTLLRCDVYGGYADDLFYYCPYDGATALEVSYSHVTVLDSRIEGGFGSDTLFSGGPGRNGGEGALVLGNSTLAAYRSTFQGGARGIGGCGPSCSGPSCSASEQLCDPGAEGVGLAVAASATADWKDSTFSSVGGQGIVTEVALAPLCIGTYEECPCGNHGAGTAGCEHSLGLGGAHLAGVGNASVSADTVLLQVTGLSPIGAPTALLFQGTTGVAKTPFGDGLLCTGGTIRRLKAKPASNGAVAYGTGQAGDPALSIAGQLPPGGGTRFYQVWYRNNAASFCTPQRFNLSNGVEITWAP